MHKVEIKPWQVLESSTEFSSRWLRVRKDIVRTNRGNITEYYVVDRFDYVLIVALTADSQVLTVRQYKHGAGQVIRELPAGYIEDGEDPVVSAQRELREETGYEAAQIEPLAVLFASPSASSHRAHVFLATGLRHAGEQQLDANEKIVVQKIDFAAAVQAAVHNRDFRDVNSTAALLLAWHRLHNENHAQISPRRAIASGETFGGVNDR